MFDWIRWLQCLALVGVPCAATLAQDPPAAAAPSTNAVVRQVGPGLFEIGLVKLDQKRRTVTLPAFVNLREGVIEYVLVHSNGKTHESILRTDAQPQHIHLAMILLGARGSQTNDFSADPTDALPGDVITADVQWSLGRRGKSVAVEELVYDRRLRSALRRGRWIYTGSRLRDDGFAAQADGSIISLITDPDALVNNPRPGREDDDNWLAKAKRLPEFNEPVQVILTLTGKPAASSPTGPSR